jgi:hypothetical protein
VLHPDLSRLQERYNEVLDEYEAGNISYEDALATVQAMSVVDGSGFIWAIDSISGSFLRAVPGELPVETDPSEFTPARIPTQGSAPWASQQDLLRPPHRPQPPANQPPQNYPQGYPQEYPQDYPQDFYQGSPQGYPQAPGSQDLYTPMMNRRSTKPSALSSLSSSLRNIKLPPLLERNKKILVIALAMIVLFIAVSFFRGDDPAPTIPPASTVPSTPVPSQPVDTTPPSTLAPEPAPTTLPAPSPNDTVPSNPEIAALLTDLTSGDRLKVAAAVLNKKDDRAVVLYTARYKGYDATGLGMAVYTPFLEGNKVFSEVRLIDKASNTELATKRVRWVRDPSGRWVWNAFIDFES